MDPHPGSMDHPADPTPLGELLSVVRAGMWLAGP